jgi:hypothetical protein
MSGNEILLNMRNVENFRNGELVNSLYELSKRIHLPENSEFLKYNWEEHPYVKEVLIHIRRRVMIFNVF